MMIARIAAGTLLILLYVGAAAAPPAFTLTSPDLPAGKPIGDQFTANTWGCHGANESPDLKWVNAPAGTKSFALLMSDPEGGAPVGVSHWVAYGIPVGVTGFAEGEVSKDSDKYVGGKSTMGVGHYSGPCTPPHASPHHYTFILIASDFEPKELPPGLTRDEVIAKFGPARAHLKGATGMIGLFVNPWHE